MDDITNEEQTTFVARTMTPWVPWSGSAGDQDVVGVPTGTAGMFYGTGSPTPGTSTIPTISDGVISSYQDWRDSTTT